MRWVLGALAILTMAFFSLDYVRTKQEVATLHEQLEEHIKLEHAQPNRGAMPWLRKDRRVQIHGWTRSRNYRGLFRIYIPGSEVVEWKKVPAGDAFEADQKRRAEKAIGPP